uniref:Peptidase S8 pro-domain domain-containing protein n=2 Tax=Culex quinquefasciatus TaxID=7176 RepID=A0A1S4KGZ7_CULQU
MLVVCGFQQQQFEALFLACQCLSKWVGAGLEWHGKSGPRKTNMVKDLFGVVNKAKELGANDSNIGPLKGYYLFHHSHVRKRSLDRSEVHHNALNTEP